MAKRSEPIISRRGFTRSITAVGLAAVSSPFLRRSALGQTRGELVFAGRGGTLGTIWRQKIIKPFEEKFSCTVTYVTDDSVPAVAKVVAQMANPQVDLLWGTDQTHVQGLVAGAFAPIDFSRVPNATDCYDFARYPDNMGVLWGIGVNLPGYNTDIYAKNGVPEPKSWMDVFIPQVAGHAGWFDLSTLQGTNSFLMVNRKNGGSETNIDPGFTYLKDHLPQFFAVVSSPTQIEDMFRQGNIWIAPNLDSRFLLLAKQGFPIKLCRPVEGSPQVSVTFELVKGGPNPDLAHEFVNWSLSPEMQAVIANDMQLGPVNEKTKVDPEIAGNIIYGEERVNSLIRFDYGKIAPNLDAWIKRWNKEMTR